MKQLTPTFYSSFVAGFTPQDRHVIAHVAALAGRRRNAP